MAEIRNVSDTATWAALYRANESDRPDALFHDPFARRLAGPRGELVAKAMRDQERHAWAWVIRTWAFDELIARCIASGTDTVLNLAAGLDARPYRMELPASLRWIEVDLAPVLAYKSEVLRDEKPKCALERVPLDLADRDARRELFARIRGANVLVLTEGLLIYLTPDDVVALGRDLSPFRHWLLDVASPGILKMMKREVGARLEAANAPFHFAPTEGPDFFKQAGWELEALLSTAKTAAKLKRAPWYIRLLAGIFPDNPRAGNRPWSGICLMRREASA